MIQAVVIVLVLIGLALLAWRYARSWDEDEALSDEEVYRHTLPLSSVERIER
jgi:hypothetical protein